MEIRFIKIDGDYECVGTKGSDNSLEVFIEGECDGARVSLIDNFSTLKESRAKLELPEGCGKHPLYLHNGNVSRKICTLEICDGRVGALENERNAIYALRKRLAGQIAECRELKARIAELEARVFRTVIF
jgi:hypothetical protein